MRLLLVLSLLFTTVDPSAEDVYRALGVQDTPTDYVLLVDTSGSMAENRRYDDVRDNLRTFLGKLEERDQVTLITFDVLPSVLHTGSPSGAVAAIDKMPAVPKGLGTDIGRALDTALAVLEGGKPGQSGAVVLITDGIAQPPADSRYRADNGPEWTKLAERGQALAARASGYVVPVVSGESGTGQMMTVVPNTVVLPFAGGVGGFLDRLQEQVKRGNARRALGDDAKAGVKASWELPGGADLSETVEVTLVLESTARKMPLDLRNLRAELDGVPGELTGLPDRVELAPGERRELALTLSSTEAGWTRLGRAEVPARAKLTFEADAGTPWRTVLERELAVQLAIPAVRAEGTWSGVVSSGVPWGYIAALFLALIALLVLGLVVWVRRHPAMRGMLVATGGDETRHRILVHGARTLKFPRPEHHGVLGGEFHVRGALGPVRGTPVLTFRKPGGQKGESRQCPPGGEELDLYGVVFQHYPDDRG
ncbi:VWA domain-containing protein [Lentzea sp. JNUCC 0626]|uniref:vWA domain-containing protein n=1 Tax=Lentzea sp. JNUCC 0626 TaxID=3367513 RepID=UPI0037488D37